MTVDECRSCKAKIVWAVTEQGKSMPVDAEPVEGGNVYFVGSPETLCSTTEAGRIPIESVVAIGAVA